MAETPKKTRLKIISRKAKKSDLKTLFALSNKLLRFHKHFFPEIYKFNKKYPSMQKRFFEKNIRSSKSCVFVAELDGKLIAYTLAIAKKYSPPIYIWKKEISLSDLYVEAPFRGSGVAKRLFYEVEKFARKNKADFINLGVDSKNARARRFYEKMGMKDFRVIMVLKVKQ